VSVRVGPKYNDGTPDLGRSDNQPQIISRWYRL